MTWAKVGLYLEIWPIRNHFPSLVVLRFVLHRVDVNESQPARNSCPRLGFTKRRPTARDPRPTSRPTARRPAAHFTVRGPTARGLRPTSRPGGPRPGQYIIFLRLLQDGRDSTRETVNYQNNTPVSQWLAHIGLGHI